MKDLLLDKTSFFPGEGEICNGCPFRMPGIDPNTEKYAKQTCSMVGGKQTSSLDSVSGHVSVPNTVGVLIQRCRELSEKLCSCSDLGTKEELKKRFGEMKCFNVKD